jgi:phosphonate transport system ATP-binding protein
MTAPVIMLRNLSLQIGDTVLLDSVDLNVTAGERIGIIGPNGAGKSSLLRLLGGTATGRVTGDISVLDRDLRQRLSRREQQTFHSEVGKVFQSLQLVPRLSTLDNVMIGALARHRSPLSWARLFPVAESDVAQQILRKVGLETFATVRTDCLSGGQRQKVALARLLMQRPRLILADEPTAALDPTAAAEMAALLASCARDAGIVMLTVVHEPALLPLLAERVIGLRQGRIVFDVPTAAVTAPHLAALYEGIPHRKTPRYAPPYPNLALTSSSDAILKVES